MFWGQIKKSFKPICLSIGAPTSPMLSNLLLYDLDVELSSLATKLHVAYTRYADDITVSGATLADVVEFERLARKTVKQLRSPRLKFNETKRGLYLKGQRRLVTGLVVTPTESISIGRERKRLISSLLHRSLLGQLDAARRSYLKGMLGFCLANEPTFVERMRLKYGSDAVNAALSFWAPRRFGGVLAS
jgi:RNA-directed DNA polymerase